MRTASLRTIAPLLLLFIASLGHAHSDDTLMPGTKVIGGISTTWRNEAGVDDGERWQIPGIMMGGEALPPEEGPTLDQAALIVKHRTDAWHAVLEASTHHNDGDVELEQALAGYLVPVGTITALIEGGRRNASMTPYNGLHASERLFSEANLAQDAFLGRHFGDISLHLKTRLPAQISLGIETWRGDSFPATPGDNGGAEDIYLHWQFENYSMAARTGVWAMQADAIDREDGRYSSGHSHGGTTIEAPAYQFTGETQTAGFFFEISAPHHANLVPMLTVEAMQQQVDSEVTDDSRIATLDAEYYAWRVEPALRWHQHQIGLRYEKLELDNQLSGAGAPVLVNTTGLSNDGNDPQRVGLAYRYALSPAFALRAEFTKDETQTEGEGLEARNRIGLGIIWQDTLWTK